MHISARDARRLDRVELKYCSGCLGRGGPGGESSKEVKRQTAAQSAAESAPAPGLSHLLCTFRKRGKTQFPLGSIDTFN